MLKENKDQFEIRLQNLSKFKYVKGKSLQEENYVRDSLVLYYSHWSIATKGNAAYLMQQMGSGD